MDVIIIAFIFLILLWQYVLVICNAHNLVSLLTNKACVPSFANMMFKRDSSKYIILEFTQNGYNHTSLIKN